MSELAHLQRRFLAALTSPESSDELALRGTQSFPAPRGLGVYQSAYLQRLVDCLSNSFPALVALLGPEAFSALAAEYVLACPPNAPNLAALGAGFADHLDATRPEGERFAFTAELARYERAIDEVFDGPGAEGLDPLDAAALQGLSPEDWSLCRLTPTPALRLLRFAFPVDDYWDAVRDLAPGALAPSPPERTPQWIALTRRDYVVRRLVCDPGAWSLLERLCQGATVGEGLEGLEGGVDPVALQRWFARWMAEGLFVGLKRC